MATPKTATELIKSQMEGLVKQYVEFDGTDRTFRIYTAATNARTGDPCLVTEYIYDGVSTRVIGRKEGYSTWDDTFIPDSAFSGVPVYQP